MQKKITIEFMGASFGEACYKLETTEYTNNKQKLEYVCPNGHRHSITWANWVTGYRCPYCSGNAKLTIEFIRAEFAKEDCQLLITNYINNRQKLKYICPNGHEHSVSWSKWINGRRCPYCSKKIKKTIEVIKTEFEKEEYKLETDIYINAHQKLPYKCPNGHRHQISWAEWNNLGNRCPYCANRPPMNIEFIESEFAEERYVLLTKKYKNNIQKLEYICSNGHKHSISWQGWQQGQRCPKCSNRISKWEVEVKKFLDNSNINYISNDRTQLINSNTKYSLELDIFMPDLSKAIECNGIYWHNDKKRKQLDNIKQQLCRDKNIDLLVITDNEWNENIEKCKLKVINFIKNQKEI